VLLRERLGLRARVPAKSVIHRAPPNRLVFLVERYLPNRAGVALTVLMLLGSAGLGIVKGGHLNDFLALLDRYPQVRAATKAAILVGERRWNLRLKDGLDIRLPENDVGNALAVLSKLDKEDRLFSRDIVAVDMRLLDRLTVQLSDDAAKAREELFKDKKTKKKPGDAA